MVDLGFMAFMFYMTRVIRLHRGQDTQLSKSAAAGQALTSTTILTLCAYGLQVIADNLWP